MLLAESSIALFIMIIFYVIGQLKRDMSLVDIAWGSTIACLALGTVFFSGNLSIHHLLVVGLMVCWGVRLTVHIASRKQGKSEDPRYTALRNKWGVWQPLISFFAVFVLQALLAVIMATPALVSTTYHGPVGLIDALGIIIWFMGMTFEIVADWQLGRFAQDPANKGKVLQTGVWSLSRHPNYFGEITLWWGVCIMTLHLPFGWISLAAPLLIMVLLLYVSGIPMLERQFDTNPEYQRYKRSTNALIPWFPKKS